MSRHSSLLYFSENLVPIFGTVNVGVKGSEKKKKNAAVIVA